MTPTKKKVVVHTVHYKQLTLREKTEACSLWAAGVVTIENLEIKFGRPALTFRRLFERNGIERGSLQKAIDDRVKEEVERTISSNASILSKRIEETQEDHYKLDTLMQRIASKRISECVTKEGGNLLTLGPEAKVWKDITSFLSQVREDRYVILKIKDDDGALDELPELTVNEMTADQINEVQQKRNQQDSPIEVAIKSLGKETPEAEVDDRVSEGDDGGV